MPVTAARYSENRRAPRTPARRIAAFHLRPANSTVVANRRQAASSMWPRSSSRAWFAVAIRRSFTYYW